MPSSRPNGRRRIEPRQGIQPRRVKRNQARSARRARRFALLVLLAAVFVVALALVAFGGKGNGSVPVSLTSPTSTRATPLPEIVALRGSLRLQLPIAQARVTAIGYSTAMGALSLSPVGQQANEGILSRFVHGIFGGGGSSSPRWYQLGGGGTNALNVGALAGTDVYAPVDGVVAAIRPFIVMGKQYGSEIDIQSQNSPSLVVAVMQLTADPTLTVGSAVVSGATKLGSVVDLASVEQQALAQYTNDGGNHVTIEVRATPAVSGI